MLLFVGHWTVLLVTHNSVKEKGYNELETMHKEAAMA